MTEQQADIRARITALRAQRKPARFYGDGDKAIELSNEIYRLNEQEQRIIRNQAQEAGMSRQTERELVATAKGFRLAYLLFARGPMTISEVAAALEISERHAYRIVDKCSLAGPVAQDDEGRIVLAMDMVDWF